MNLAGKDYFTVPEAAHYAGISISHWRARVQPVFPPGQLHGKYIYRRTDVQRYIEQTTHWPSTAPDSSGSTPTRRFSGRGPSPLAQRLLSKTLKS